ncbi:type IV pilin [Halobaculum halobium]|uniref:Type IV pilin n=1 Tax=Halobaculum halobium TaxID=3032281 RepID=A0ABD5TGN0_9EURY|nr:type IV pilin [Halobaculum sp. SYNS20]
MNGETAAEGARSAEVTGRDRATASVVGVALLVLAAVALSATIGAAALSATGAMEPGTGATGSGSGASRSAPANAVVDLAVADGTITLRHRGGDTVDVGRLRVVIRVDGARLRHQPPLPFFAARGFESGPTGPFNPASDDAWSAGESTTLTPAGTNRPRIHPGSRVEVTLFAGSQRLAALSATAT